MSLADLGDLGARTSVMLIWAMALFWKQIGLSFASVWQSILS